MIVTCLFCKESFEVEEDSKLRICDRCLSPESITSRVNLLDKYSRPPFEIITS